MTKNNVTPFPFARWPVAFQKARPPQLPTNQFQAYEENADIGDDVGDQHAQGSRTQRQMGQWREYHGVNAQGALIHRPTLGMRLRPPSEFRSRDSDSDPDLSANENADNHLPDTHDPIYSWTPWNPNGDHNHVETPGQSPPETRPKQPHYSTASPLGEMRRLNATPRGISFDQNPMVPPGRRSGIYVNERGDRFFVKKGLVDPSVLNRSDAARHEYSLHRLIEAFANSENGVLPVPGTLHSDENNGDAVPADYRWPLHMSAYSVLPELYDARELDAIDPYDADVMSTINNNILRGVVVDTLLGAEDMHGGNIMVPDDPREGVYRIDTGGFNGMDPWGGLNPSYYYDSERWSNMNILPPLARGFASDAIAFNPDEPDAKKANEEWAEFLLGQMRAALTAYSSPDRKAEFDHAFHHHFDAENFRRAMLQRMNVMAKTVHAYDGYPDVFAFHMTKHLYDDSGRWANIFTQPLSNLRTLVESDGQLLRQNGSIPDENTSESSTSSGSGRRPPFGLPDAESETAAAPNGPSAGKSSSDQLWAGRGQRTNLLRKETGNSTQDLQQRFRRLLDGLDKDSIASWIHIDLPDKQQQEFSVENIQKLVDEAVKEEIFAGRFPGHLKDSVTEQFNKLNDIGQYSSTDLKFLNTNNLLKLRNESENNRKNLIQDQPGNISWYDSLAQLDDPLKEIGAIAREVIMQKVNAQIRKQRWQKRAAEGGPGIRPGTQGTRQWQRQYTDAWMPGVEPGLPSHEDLPSNFQDLENKVQDRYKKNPMMEGVTGWANRRADRAAARERAKDRAERWKKIAEEEFQGIAPANWEKPEHWSSRANRGRFQEPEQLAARMREIEKFKQRRKQIAEAIVRRWKPEWDIPGMETSRNQFGVIKNPARFLVHRPQNGEWSPSMFANNVAFIESLLPNDFDYEQLKQLTSNVDEYISSKAKKFSQLNKNELTRVMSELIENMNKQRAFIPPKRQPKKGRT